MTLVSGFTFTATFGPTRAQGVDSGGVRARDLCGDCRQTAATHLVLYHPDAGFVTGGGTIVPCGTAADAGDLLPGLDGKSKASFGFVAKYSSGQSNVPAGGLEFHYRAGGFHLRSTGLEWLLVSSPTWAKFQGTAFVDGR